MRITLARNLIDRQGFLNWLTENGHNVELGDEDFSSIDGTPATLNDCYESRWASRKMIYLWKDYQSEKG